MPSNFRSIEHRANCRWNPKDVVDIEILGDDIGRTLWRVFIAKQQPSESSSVVWRVRNYRRHVKTCGWCLLHFFGTGNDWMWNIRTTFVLITHVLNQRCRNPLNRNNKYFWATWKHRSTKFDTMRKESYRTIKRKSPMPNGMLLPQKRSWAKAKKPKRKDSNTEISTTKKRCRHT